MSDGETLPVAAGDGVLSEFAEILSAPIGAFGAGCDDVALNPRELRPADLVRLLNSTPLGTVTTARRLDAHRAAWAEASSGWDAVLMPATANLPPSTERLLADADHFAEENVLTLRNTRLANMLGLCALTLPTGMPGCGLMAMAPPAAEARLLRVGAALERVLA